MLRKYLLCQYNHTILLTIINILIIIFSLTNFSMAETIQDNVAVRDYIENKFDSAIFHLYLGSMGELDSKEIEFIDLLVDQPGDSQIFYGKKVYQKGFDSALLEQLKEEIKEREKLAIEKLEEAIDDIPELSLPTLPPMKFWERIYARMVSMQKIITTTDYNRFSYCGVDPARSERVVKRVKN